MDGGPLPTARRPLSPGVPLPGVPLRWDSVGPEADAARYSIEPIRCAHIANSRQAIHLAAVGLRSNDDVLILGAGSCSEIPLDTLARRFDSILLLDHEPAALEAALRALPPPLRPRVRAQIMERTGLIRDFLVAASRALEASTDPDQAASALATLARAGELRAERAARSPSTLVVASSILNELTTPTLRMIGRRFAERFPDAPSLSASKEWVDAALDLSWQAQRVFIEDLPSRIAPGGRAYVSATTLVGQVEMDERGQWTTAGWYRMLAERSLTDLMGSRWQVLFEARWPWVRVAPQPGGRTGLVYEVQSLVLAVEG